MSLTIHSPQGNPRAFKAVIAGKFVGTEVAYPEGFEMGVTNKSDAFLKKNPLGKVPVLETPQGCVFESNAIARYVARTGSNCLYGKNAFEAAQVEQWIDFSVGELELPMACWIYPIMGYIPNNPTATTKAQADIKKAMMILHNHLATRTFLVGERISLADVVIACMLYFPYKMVFDKNYRKPFGNATRWFQTMCATPQFKAVMGDMCLCEKMAVAGNAPAAQPQQKKQKEQPKKKEQAPKKKDEPAEEEEEKPKEKAKNPLDLLPPSSFVLDDWKRFFSNKEGAQVTDYFWKNYDPEGYSLWFCDYKYSDELEKIFMTCNLAGGFTHRLESLRKYGFAQILIFGDDENKGSQHIGGCFLVRGKDNMPPELTGCPDWESYDWRKVDHANDADKKLVNAYWLWEGEFPKGRKVNQGKQFK